ncbi:hypothetical protein C9993_00775 [Marinobacter sp. Z-F4-2]|nr:hypothetical protein C9993_00775 [Marinobacter sp. Z-F4-2]|tara:strand:- start:3438 stop:7526 length:4089 start_codon:yes stop_codon:yes gene_type:complete
MSTFENVLRHPRPRLDESTVCEQLGAYQEALQLLFESNLTTILTIPAGAGSGKTRTLVSTIIGLLRLGEAPDQIESISFTNASADDFQAKLIGNLAELAQQGEESVKVSNLGFSTIHKHAIDLLKKLEPHVGGVAYYFEDANSSTSLSSPQSADDAALEKATRLAFYASIVYSGSKTGLLKALEPIIHADTSDRFVLPNMKTDDHLELAHEFIKKESMSDAGLGAFTNIDDTDPNFCIAVATDSLLRLALETTHYSTDEKRQRFGLPKYMMVDEAQDVDIIQLLYLRALALNGVSVLMVGDPRQTLFEFRKSVSEWPFLDQFMSALFEGTGIEARISTSPLKTNYRCRAEILNLAEDLSEEFVAASADHPSDKIDPINDPSESVKRSHHFISGNADQDADKEAPAVRFFEGDKTEDLDFLIPNTSLKSSDKLSGPMSRLSRRLEAADDSSLSDEKKKLLKTKIQNLQIPSLCGGKNQAEIESAILELYERARKSESVAVLTRNGLKSADLKYFRSVLRKVHKDIDNPNSLRITQLNSEKNAPLSSYWFLGSDKTAHNETPFTSVMVAAAIHYCLSWDKYASDELKISGLKEFNMVAPAASVDEANRIHDKNRPQEAIAFELAPYVGALITNGSDFFPMASRGDLLAQETELTRLLSRFVKDVLMRYSVLLWESFEGRVFSHQPCRFQAIAVTRNKARGLPQVRPLMDSKRFFKLFWEALVTTPFQLSKADQGLLKRLGVNLEWLTASTSLVNFPEELSVLRETSEAQGSAFDSEVKSRFDDFIHQREVIHEQFSKLFHQKTRVYLREIAKQVGRLIRLDPASDPDFIMIAAYEHFRDARQQARVSTWSKENKGKLKFMGLFEDLQIGLRDVQVKSKPTRKGKDDSGARIPTIDFTTVHSSKGLEWDHVLLFFPPGKSDTNSSFKSVRDLLYVAITRAARTLTVVMASDKNYKKDNPKNSPMVVARHIVYQYAKENDLFGRAIELDSRVKDESETTDQKPEVQLQTSHSELEKALSCRIHHHIQHDRNLSSMVPLTAPSYSFFFHTAMSSICAGLIGQRLPINDDPVAEIVKVIDGLAIEPNLTEDRVYQALMKNVENELNDLMTSMIPMYFLSGGKRYFEVMTYYSNSFARQLASITVGSRLFQNLLVAKRVPGHRIWIEKPVKDVMTIEEHNVYLPVLGIPDIKIAGPEINYVCDYKTVQYRPDLSGELSEDALLHISEKTSVQINLYQGLVRREGHENNDAEVIYVPDITLFEGDEVPYQQPPLPAFNNNAYYQVRSNLKSAVVLATDHFDEERFEQTQYCIDELRITSAENLERLPSSMYSAAPLIGDNDMVEVTYDTCRSCPSAVHCHKRKKPDMEVA